MDMIDQLLALDFNETPNMKAIVALRDRLTEEFLYDREFVNEFVARMDVQLSCSLEEATELGFRWAEVCQKLIEAMYDNGFDQKNIISMAHQVSLKV